MLKSRLGRSVWESFVTRFAGSRRLTRQARRTLRPDLKTPASAETLEQRLVLAGSPVVVSFNAGTLTLTGTAASNDVVSVKAGTSYTDILVNSKFLTRMNGVTNSAITTIDFTGDTGTDSLSVSGITTALNIDLTGVEKLQLNVGAAGTVTTVTSDAGLVLLASTVAGDLDLTTAAGSVTQTGKVVVSGETIITAAANIILKTAGNSFGSLVLTGVDVTINEAGPTDFGATTATGNFVVTSSGPITDSGVLTITGNSTLTSNGNSITFDEASTFGGTFVLKGTNIDITDTDAGGTALGAVTATGTFSLTSGGAVTHASGNITVGGLATVAANAGAADITIQAGSNNFGSLALNGKDVKITEKSATNLSTTTATGLLTVLSSGVITDSGVVDVTGVTTLTATGSAITLDSLTSEFGSTVILKGTNIAITDNDGATSLGLSTATGNLNVTTTAAGAGVSQVGALTVAGRLTVTATGKDITLETTTNKFGSIAVDGKDVNLKEGDATDLFTSTIAGLLTLTSTGAVTDSGTLDVDGTTTISAAGKNITFDNADSTFGSTFTITSGFNVAVTDSDGATELGASTATGNLSVTTTGAAGAGVSQTGALAVTGRLTVTTTDSAAKNINLPTATNAFGSISVFGAVVALAETGSTDLFTSSATGNFDLTSTGPVTDSGDLTVGGTTDIDAGANDITLNSALSTFTGDMLLIGKDVTVFNDTATGIGTTTTTGLLSITSNGAIVDDGTIVVGTKTTLNALGHDITVNNTANTFGGTIGLFGENVLLTTGATNGNVALATSKILGTFDLTVNGNITDSGTIKVDGVTTLVTSVPGTQDITLDSGLNSFGQLLITADAVIINEFGETDLGASTVTSLKVTSSGGIEDSGTLAVTNLAELSANGGDLTLDVAASNFGSVKLQGYNIAIKETGATVLAGVTTAGTFDLLTTLGVTQTAGISVGGDAVVAATTSINLNQTGGANNFGTLDFSAGTSVVIHESSDTDLEASAAGTTLTIVSTGNITGYGVVTAAGVTDLNATGNSIDLSQVGTSFGGLKLQGNAATINDADATLLLTGTNVTGALTLISGGAVSQDANGITVGGLLSITTASTITLDDAANVLNSVSLFGTTVAITDSDGDIILATSTMTNFTLISAGNVTDSDLAVLTISGTTDINAAGDILLDEADSTFNIVVLVGLNIELNSYSALTLGAGAGEDVTATGTLTLRTFNGGAITQDAASDVSATDDAFIFASGALTLVPANNTFEGFTDHFFSNGAEVF